MKPRFLLFIIITLAATFAAGATEYYDAAAFELHGYVKSSQVLYTYNGEYSSSVYGTVYKFTKDGAYEGWKNDGRFTYDVEHNLMGFPIKVVKKRDGKLFETTKFFYNTGFLIVQKERKADYQPKWPLFTTRYTYPGNNITHESAPDAIVSNPNVEYDYSDIKTDSNGNWVKRTCRRNGKPYRVETRTITYWNASPAKSTPKIAAPAKTATAAPSPKTSEAATSGPTWMDLWQKFHMVKFYLEEYGDYIDGRRLNPKKRIAESFFLNFVGDRRGVQWNDRPDGKCYTYAGSVDGSILHITTSQTGPNPERKCDITLRLLGFEKDKFTFVENGKKYYVFKHY